MQFNFVLSEKEAQIVLNALGKEPYIQVAETINNFQTQAQAQMKPDEKVTPDNKK